MGKNGGLIPRSSLAVAYIPRQIDMNQGDSESEGKVSMANISKLMK